MTHKNATLVSLDEKRKSRETAEIVLIGRVAPTGSRPFLGTASNGHDYWCKPTNNQQGLETLIAEVATGVLGNLIGAPIPDWTTLRVSCDLHGHFIKEAGYRLDGRDVFASKVIHSADIEIINSDVLRHVQDDANYNRIPLLYAMWYLCNAEDIQFAYDPANDYSITSLDHGFWFGSHEQPWGFGSPSELIGRPEVPNIRSTIPPEHWDKAIDKLDLIDDDLSDRIGAAIPENWGVDLNLIARIADYIQSRTDYTRNQLERLKQTKGGK